MTHFQNSSKSDQSPTRLPVSLNVTRQESIPLICTLCLDVLDNHQRVYCEELRSREEYNTLHTHESLEAVQFLKPTRITGIETSQSECHRVR